LAGKIGAKTIGFTGRDGGMIKDIVDVCLMVPSSDTPRIQECHITIGHILCSIIENELFD
jgi:D-sedoheptulose 7-phosphate isomerase